MRHFETLWDTCLILMIHFETPASLFWDTCLILPHSSISQNRWEKQKKEFWIFSEFLFRGYPCFLPLTFTKMTSISIKCFFGFHFEEPVFGSFFFHFSIFYYQHLNYLSFLMLTISSIYFLCGEMNFNIIFCRRRDEERWGGFDVNRIEMEFYWDKWNVFELRWSFIELRWSSIELRWGSIECLCIKMGFYWIEMEFYWVRWSCIERNEMSLKWDGVMKCLWSEMELWNVFDVNWCAIHVWYTCLNVLLLNDTLASFCWYTLRQLPHFDDTLWHSCLILWIQKIKIA